MNLRDVIKLLQKLQGEHGGDLPVYVNGECGEEVKARSDHFTIDDGKVNKVRIGD